MQYIIVVSSAEATEERPLPPVLFRSYLIKSSKSGQKLPRIELEEMGPRFDFKIGRVQEPPEEVLKEAMQKPKQLVPKKKKNIAMDVVGDKVGRVHVGKQDLRKLQTRKMKGLRKRDFEDGDDGSAPNGKKSKLVEVDDV